MVFFYSCFTQPDFFHEPSGGFCPSDGKGHFRALCCQYELREAVNDEPSMSFSYLFKLIVIGDTGA